MQELAMVALVLGGLTGLGALLTMVAPDTLATIGFVLVGGGMLVGVPAGVVYHVLLARGLAGGEKPPRGWYWHPMNLHPRIAPEARTRIMRWLYTGGLGFVVTVFGCVLVATGIVRAIIGR